MNRFPSRVGTEIQGAHRSGDIISPMKFSCLVNRDSSFTTCKEGTLEQGGKTTPYHSPKRKEGTLEQPTQDELLNNPTVKWEIPTMGGPTASMRANNDIVILLARDSYIDARSPTNNEYSEWCSKNDMRMMRHEYNIILLWNVSEWYGAAVNEWSTVVDS